MASISAPLKQVNKTTIKTPSHTNYLERPLFLQSDVVTASCRKQSRGGV